MEQRRLLFWLFAFGFGLVYWIYVVPIMRPQWFRPPVPQEQVAEQGNNPAENGEMPDVKKNDKKPDGDKPDKEKKPELVLDKHPRKTVTLGSLDPKSGYFIEVQLTTQGGAISQVTMNDPVFKKLESRKEPLVVVGSQSRDKDWVNSLSIDVPSMNLNRFKTDGNSVDWAIDQATLREDHVLFYFESPDRTVRAEKEFTVVKSKTGNRETETAPYVVKFDIRLINKGKESQKLGYLLQGPVGIPLEDKSNARRYLELQLGYQNSGEKVEYSRMTAVDIANQVIKAEENHDPDVVFSTKRPLKFIGIDERYFVALLVPEENQLEHGYFDKVRAQSLEEYSKSQRIYTPISFTAQSHDYEVETDKQVSHSFNFYTGPKRDSLLVTFQAEELMQFGWFSWFSRWMLWVMKTLHDTAYFPYWLAIIVLTVIVRGAMYPMSRKQALSMKHIKDMQPAINELQQKYKDDKEKLAVAQLQLMKEHGVSPLMGCMPFFLIMMQMPIFIGLYNALANAIELRLAPFLYINDLASPDKLAKLPFNIPFLETADVNLLPMLTIVLFLVQQRMYMPPATTDEQKVQQQMMTFMMVFMGFMFYKVPSGLCVYFIASSLWGLVERRILEWHDDAIEKRKATKAANQKESNSKVVIETKDYNQKEENAKPSWLKDVIQKIDKAANPKEYQNKPPGKNDGQNK